MEIKMPKLGESVHEGTIESWLVDVGDTINEYESLCEVMTDKVTAEVPSTVSGTVSEILVAAGETIAVGTPICRVESSGESNKQQDVQQLTASEEIKNENLEQPSPQPAGQKRYSPVVFKLAAEHNIDLLKVKGTGFEGRITKKDIMQLINHSSTDKEASKEVVPRQSVPVNGVRKAIAAKMVQSVSEIPHAWMMIETDVTSLVTTRNHYKDEFKEKEGYALTYFAFFVKAVAAALKQYPMLNSSWQDDDIIIHPDINISIAVASDDRLYVPVIKNADELSIKGIARKIAELAKKGRSHQLTAEDMQGGTFTVNNTGSFGSVQSMGIINHPHAAILQVESIVKRPVVINDMIAIRQMCNLCLSIDHRILDGLVAGQFINCVKEQLEQMTLEHTAIY